MRRQKGCFVCSQPREDAARRQQSARVEAGLHQTSDTHTSVCEPPPHILLALSLVKPGLIYPILFKSPLVEMFGQENQDGGVGRHTAPPRTTRTDRESNSKGDQHQGNRK